MLISGSAPGEAGVGGVFLSDVLAVAGHPPARTVWMPPRTEKDVPAVGRSGSGGVRRIDRCYETAYRPVRGAVGHFAARTGLAALRPRWVRRAAELAASELSDWRPDRVLVVLNSISSIEVGAAVVAGLRADGTTISCLVWDDPDLLSIAAVYGERDRQRVRRRFAEVLQAADRLAVISEPMRDAYAAEFGVTGFPLPHGVARPSGSVLKPERSGRDGPLAVGYAGSVTAPDAFEALLGGLDALGWEVGDREVCLRLFGLSCRLTAAGPRRIEFYGWRDRDEMLDRLTACDLLYMPQPFAPDARAFSELSFPAKLSTYVAARRPVLLHAPDYASLRGFWKNYPLGPVCDRVDAGAVAETLRTSLENPAAFDAALVASDRAYREVLGPGPFAAGASRLLDVAVPAREIE